MPAIVCTSCEDCAGIASFTWVSRARPKSRILAWPSLCQKQVFRLQIAMDDALFMGRCQPLRNLYPIVDNFTDRQRAALQPVAKRLALQELRNKVRRSVVQPHLVHGQNIGVIQGGRRTRLLFETAQPVRLGRRKPRQNLDGDVAIQPRVPGAIHLAHASRPNERNDFVVIDELVRTERHLRDYISPIVSAIVARTKVTRVDRSKDAGSSHWPKFSFLPHPSLVDLFS